MYLLKLWAQPWKVSPGTQFLSVGMTGILLFLVFFFLWVPFFLDPIESRLQVEKKFSFILSASDSSSSLSEEEWKKRIHLHLREHGTKELKIHYVTSSEVLSWIQKVDKTLGEQVYPYVPSYLSISGPLSQEACELLKNLPGVDGFEFSEHLNAHLLRTLGLLKKVFQLVLLGVGAALSVGLVTLAQSNPFFASSATQHFSYWGGGPFFTFLPSLLMSFSWGILGGLLASGLWWGLGQALFLQLASLFPEMSFEGSFFKSFKIYGPLFLSSGMGLGFLISLLTYRRIRLGLRMLFFLSLGSSSVMASGELNSPSVFPFEKIKIKQDEMRDLESRWKKKSQHQKWLSLQSELRELEELSKNGIFQELQETHSQEKQVQAFLMQEKKKLQKNLFYWADALNLSPFVLEDFPKKSLFFYLIRQQLQEIKKGQQELEKIHQKGEAFQREFEFLSEQILIEKDREALFLKKYPKSSFLKLEKPCFYGNSVKKGFWECTRGEKERSYS